MQQLAARDLMQIPSPHARLFGAGKVGLARTDLPTAAGVAAANGRFPESRKPPVTGSSWPN
jgi:hypothetical protein